MYEDDLEKEFKLPKGWLKALGKTESGGKHYAEDGSVIKSKAGAIGKYQLMPETAAWMGVNPYDEKQNAYGAAKYGRYLLDRFHGDVELATLANNWGEGRVMRAMKNAKLTGDDIHSFIDNKESREYTGKVFANWKADLGVDEIDTNTKPQSFSIGSKDAPQMGTPTAITNNMVDQGGVKLAKNTMFENLFRKA